jgi:hypothetical protein
MVLPTAASLIKGFLFIGVFMTKICIKCNKEKDIEEFKKDISKNGGYANTCKKCDCVLSKERYYKNKNKKLEYQKKYYKENKNNIDLYRELYRKRNSIHIGLYQGKWRKNHIDIIKNNNKKYRITHKNEIREMRNRYHFNKKNTDINYVIKRSLRSSVNHLIKSQNYSKKMSILDTIGCDLDTLKKHLESTFAEGMTWNNYGKWQIDHIIPCAVFDLSDVEQQKICFNYKNLQALWKKDNLLKRDFLPNGIKGRTIRGAFDKNKLNAYIQNHVSMEEILK